MRKIIASFSFLTLLVSINPVFAVQPRVQAELETPGTSRHLLLPAAADYSPVISLGETIDPASGEVVEGLAFVHYKKGLANNNARRPRGGGSACYAFLASGAKWQVPEGYIFDPTNIEGLDSVVLSSLLATSAESWDGQVAADVFGVETPGVVDGVESSAPDGKNEVLFGDVSSQGAIAVTIVWGIFSGPPSQRKLVEWDMVFDQVDFDWSAEATGVAGKMDFHNIAVHEVGHAAGMGHPDSSCADETMYAYADFAETKKRDLNTGDVAGIKALYQ